MAQIFHPALNPIARAVIFGGVLIIAVWAWAWTALYRSPLVTDVNVVRHQPVPFSHQHHVAGLGIDCRYCHTSVEQSAFAGMPPTQTCMTCHSKIWTNAALLEPVRQSWQTGIPIQWTRVHRLPDYVFFNHSIHVAKGVGCTTCHGQVNRMPLMWKVSSLQMEWCLGCHRNPGNYLRPRERVFDLDWRPGEEQVKLGRKLVKEYHVRVGQLDNCYICHR